MDKKLFNKILADEQLSAEESLRLDEALESKASAAAVSAVRALGDEAPSLAWRSDLNEKLMKGSRRRRTQVMWRYGLAVTAGATAMFLFVNFSQPIPGKTTTFGEPAHVSQAASLEDDVLSDHQNAMTQASMGVIVSFDGSAGF